MKEYLKITVENKEGKKSVIEIEADMESMETDVKVNFDPEISGDNTELYVRVTTNLIEEFLS